jgi:hypothetical protein
MSTAGCSRKAPKTQRRPTSKRYVLMTNEKVFAMSFASVYPHYVTKAEKKGRTKKEVEEVIRWLTGYSKAGLEKQIETRASFREFFEKAPKMNPNVSLIRGVVCGIRVEEIDDPLMQKIRYLDKLIDELAKGKKMEKILRNSE